MNRQQLQALVRAHKEALNSSEERMLTLVRKGCVARASCGFEDYVVETKSLPLPSWDRVIQVLTDEDDLEVEITLDQKQLRFNWSDEQECSE